MEIHLSGCQGCRERAAALAATKDFTLQKLRLLDAVEIPVAPVLNLPGAPLEQPHAPFFRRFFGLSIPIPVAAAAMIILFAAGLSLGLALHRQPARLSVSSSQEGSFPFYIASSRFVRALSIDLDLTGYSPIDQPRLIITQEGLK